MDIISLILIFELVILFHELGHYIAAKIFNVHIIKVSLGFGPCLLKKQFSHTEYVLSLIPIGGFVRLAASEDEAVGKGKTLESINKAQKALIMASGVFFNLLLAFIFIWASFFFYGSSTTKNKLEIVGIDKFSAAQESDLRIGDQIVAINGIDVETILGLKKIIDENIGDQVNFLVKRKYLVFSTQVYTRKNPETNKYSIGFQVKSIPYTAFVNISPLESIKKSGEYLIKTTISVISGYYDLIKKPQTTMDSVESPSSLVKKTGEFIDQGARSTLFFIAIISINIGIFNLLPIPGLDGGFLLLLVIEILSRKQLTKQLQRKIQIFGTCGVVLLLYTIFYFDLMK